MRYKWSGNASISLAPYTCAGGRAWTRTAQLDVDVIGHGAKFLGPTVDVEHAPADVLT